LLQRQARAVAEPRGEEDGLTRGARASAAGEKGAAAVTWCGAGLARLGCWRVAGPSGKRGGELGWGWCWAAGKKGRGASGPNARKEGEKKKRILFLFPTIFQISFSIRF